MNHIKWPRDMTSLWGELRGAPGFYYSECVISKFLDGLHLDV